MDIVWKIMRVKDLYRIFYGCYLDFSLGKMGLKFYMFLFEFKMIGDFV